MKSIWFEDIMDVMLNIADPNTWWAISSVPWVSSPKINAGVSIYNVEADGEWIAWWSTNISWSSTDYNTVAWGSGDICLPDWTTLSVISWNTGDMSGMTYIYYDRDLWGVYTTNSAQSSVWANKILLCVASPTTSWKDAEFQAFWTNAQSTFITADNIAANTITWNEIYANSITSSEIATWAITSNKIAVKAVWTDELDDWAVTADKIYVTELSAINADLWSITAWDITGTTITAGSTSGTAVRLNPNNNRIEFYHNWSMVWYMLGWSVDWNGAILLDANFVWMTGRDIFDLNWAKLRIPVWTNLY